MTDIRIADAGLKGLDRLRDALNLDVKELLLAVLASSLAECGGHAPLLVRYLATRIRAESGAVLRYGFPVCLEHRDDPLESVKHSKAALKQVPGEGLSFELLTGGAAATRSDAGRMPAVRFAWLGYCAFEGFEPATVLASGEGLSVSAYRLPSGLVLRLAVDAAWADELPALAATLHKTLEAYLAAAEQAEGRGFTTADFDDAGLSEEDFDTLFQTIE